MAAMPAAHQVAMLPIKVALPPRVPSQHSGLQTEGLGGAANPLLLACFQQQGRQGRQQGDLGTTAESRAVATRSNQAGEEQILLPTRSARPRATVAQQNRCAPGDRSTTKTPP